MTDATRATIAWAARNEITEYHIYSRVAKRTKDPKNREILQNIAEQEHQHYARWKRLLGHDVSPAQWRIWLYTALVHVFGLSFGLRLMEQGERLSARTYHALAQAVPEAADVVHDEQQHEQALLALIDEQRLQYVSSFVLGLNDALVELTGALAGLTLALGDTRLISMVGLITGIAASCAMAGSEYLSTQEEKGKNALRSGLTTGGAYIMTVFLLILPYFFLHEPLTAFLMTLSVAILIILAFTFYTAVAKNMSFRRKFSAMLAISLGSAIFNFGVGYVIKTLFSVDAA